MHKSQSFYLNSNEANRYLKKPWNKNLKHGLFFSSLLKYQQDINFIIDVNDYSIKFLHSIYDGFSALKLIERRFKIGLILEGSKKEKEHSNKFKSIYNYIKSDKYSNFEFNKIESKLKNSTIQSQIIFTKQQTKSIQQSLKINKGSLTSAFIFKLNNIISKELLSINSSTPWMIPVNLRGEIKNNSKMQSSFIRVSCLVDDNEKTLKNKISKSLKGKEHLGLYYLGSISLMLGKKLIDSITKKEFTRKKPKWFASFSNLGDIKGDEKNTLIIWPTIRYQRPIGIVAYIFAKRLHITMNFDQSIANKNEVERIKDEFYKSIIFQTN
jgi:hypothetical protein